VVGCPLKGKTTIKGRGKAWPMEGYVRVPSLFSTRSNQALRPAPPKALVELIQKVSINEAVPHADPALVQRACRRLRSAALVMSCAGMRADGPSIVSLPHLILAPLARSPLARQHCTHPAAQARNGIFTCAACRPAHAPCSARSPLARALPCVDRTIGDRNLIAPRVFERSLRN
jgi:hypothetical protein